MKRLDVRLTRSAAESIPVGRLAEADRRLYFQYDPGFLGRRLELSPLKLPLRPGVVEHVDRAFGPLPGLFDDSLPDGWGLLLMDRLFRARGLDPRAVSVLDRLAYLGTRTMGALTYHPPADADRDDRPLDLAALARNAAEVVRGDAVDVLPQLLRAGGSPGGAGPKVLVGLGRGDEIISGEQGLPPGFEHWIVKFPSKDGPPAAGPVEYAYSLMAAAAGVVMPPTRLIRAGRHSHFAVRRFDRTPPDGRAHVHTFANLIHADYRIPSTDYADLLKVTRILTRDHADVLQVFRRMVFNVAARNRDDHAKNFAFVMDDRGEWHASPAYDLTSATGPGGEHATTVAGEGGSPAEAHVLRLAEQFDVRAAEARQIIDDVRSAVARWPEFADQAGCPVKLTREVATGLKSAWPTPVANVPAAPTMKRGRRKPDGR